MSSELGAPGQLVAGRACGGCTACCHELLIDGIDLQKLPGLSCPHILAGLGCRIHERRPGCCRAFHCGWRKLASFDDDWRPDRKGIMLIFDETPMPGGGATWTVDFLLMRPPSQVLDRRTVAAIGRLIGQGTPVYLAVPGPYGHRPARCRLNDLLAEAVAARDGEKMFAGLSEALDSLLNFDCPPIAFAHGPAGTEMAGAALAADYPGQAQG